MVGAIGFNRTGHKTRLIRCADDRRASAITVEEGADIVLVVGKFVHHVCTDHKDVFQMRISGDQAGSLCQSGWEGSAGASNIPCASVDTTKFVLGNNRCGWSDVIRAVSTHYHQINILRGQPCVSDGCFSCFCSQVRSRPVIRGVKSGLDPTAILKLENNLCQFWVDLTHPFSKSFIGNFIFGNVHPGS